MNVTQEDQKIDNAYRKYFHRLNELREEIEKKHWDNIKNVNSLIEILIYHDTNLEDYMELMYAKKKEATRCSALSSRTWSL